MYWKSVASQKAKCLILVTEFQEAKKPFVFVVVFLNAPTTFNSWMYKQIPTPLPPPHHAMGDG